MHKLYFFKVRKTPFSFLGICICICKLLTLQKKISRKAPWLFWGASENLHSAAGLFPHNISFRPLLYLLEEPCLLVWLLRSQDLFAIFRNDKLNGRLPSRQSLSWLTSPRPSKSEKLAKIIVKSCKPRIPSKYFQYASSGEGSRVLLPQGRRPGPQFLCLGEQDWAGNHLGNHKPGIYVETFEEFSDLAGVSTTQGSPWQGSYMEFEGKKKQNFCTYFRSWRKVFLCSCDGFSIQTWASAKIA